MTTSYISRRRPVMSTSLMSPVHGLHRLVDSPGAYNGLGFAFWAVFEGLPGALIPIAAGSDFAFQLTILSISRTTGNRWRHRGPNVKPPRITCRSPRQRLYVTYQEIESFWNPAEAGEIERALTAIRPRERSRAVSQITSFALPSASTSLVPSPRATVTRLVGAQGYRRQRICTDFTFSLQAPGSSGALRQIGLSIKPDRRQECAGRLHSRLFLRVLARHLNSGNSAELQIT